MASFSANFKKVDAHYCVDGGLSAANVAEVAKDHAGALYLCGDDSGCEGGFGAVQSQFAKALSCPFDPSNPEFQVGNTDIHRAVLAYKRFEDALDSLPTPTAIMCKSANRASAVLAAYKAVKGKWDKNQVAEYARANELKFVAAAGLLSWVNTVVDALNRRNGLIFRQLFEKESSTYTYLLADQVTKEAILIDPVLETVARDSALVQDLGLTLKYVINTHVHADHITGTGSLKGLHPGCQSALSAASTGKADVLLNPGDTLTFGTRSVKALPTPGHTAGCVSYVLDDLSCVFTGDALLIRGCGRTDFQGGSAATLYESVHTQLFNNLPPSCLVYPAHDYKGNTCSSIREESSLNPRLTKPLPEFIAIMDNLNLPYPAKFDKSVPANLVCGLF